MITLITGVPGTGKSALALTLLLRVVYGSQPLSARLRRWLQGIGHRWFKELVASPAPLAQARQVFVVGIPELKVPHDAWTYEQAQQWPELAPVGAAIVIDEVQKMWRPRGAGAKVPEEIKALEEHRHSGNDFFLITQKPRLLDSNVRDLVGRHVHIRDCGILGRWLYEWPECSENLAWRSAPIKRRYTLPRHVFTLYKSASLHVKPIRGFPTALLFAFLAVCGTAWFGWKSFEVIKGKMSPQAVAKAPSGVASSPGALPVAARPAMASFASPAAQSVRVSSPVKDREPFDGYGIHVGGSYSVGQVTKWAFSLSLDGRHVMALPLERLLQAGYSWRAYGPCSGVLIFGERERAVRCDAPRPLDLRSPAAPASSGAPS